MKVFIQPETDSRGIMRVVNALEDYTPPHLGLEFVQSPQDAEFEVIHVVGRHDRVERRIADARAAGRRYAIIQYCLRSTMRKNTHDWMVMWQRARVVWSYYDLFRLCDEDGTRGEFSFYYAPLGVDPNVFKESSNHSRPFIIAASSQHALSESARECAIAAKKVGMPMFYLGNDLRRGSDIVCRTGITDTELARWYSECKFVSGLRRTEGFEFPVIEGALCGARPIVFNRPEMQKWYKDFAIFIEELDRPSVINQLRNIFSRTVSYVVEENQKAVIRKRFDWNTIIPGFWKEALS